MSQLYAVVADRDEKGRPTRLALPAPLAGPSVSLYARRADGTASWLGAVTRSGAVRTDRDWMLESIAPGVEIVAACDPSGRVLHLSAMCSVSRGDRGLDVR